MNESDLQIWNNAAFDNGDKENQSPLPRKSRVSIKTPAPVKPLHVNGLIGNSQGNPKTNQILKPGLVEKPSLKSESEGEVRDEIKIDAEIEEIQMEITRLSSRLEALRLEKAEQKLKSVERRGRVVPAKFMEQKQSFRNLDGERKIEESSSMSARTKVQRRGFSLGPAEIATGARRGVNIEEEKVTKERGKSLSISPKSRKTISKTQSLRQAVTTLGPKKAAKKEERFFSTIQPKKLFKEGEKSVKKPVKPGRVVASRYNQSSSGNSALRKRPKSRGSKPVEEALGNSPVEVVVHESPVSVTKMPDLLPRIRTLRCVNDTPRDSGPAKRVAELIGRKSYFCDDEKVEASVCQALSFAEDVEEQ
ncbi:hypothetical protein Acr_17g0011740 [Actinidia rufa]|uniref:Uncharacterized protein n=1 Tax=Actinidia rufa TaxID=165716 RepID=A0A7J0G4E3_9ERIC|nr:hypothetical protein Acr_17g0011740 [Actinidia rufa]